MHQQSIYKNASTKCLDNKLHQQNVVCFLINTDSAVVIYYVKTICINKILSNNMHQQNMHQQSY